jgi:hypothetical protein
MKGTRWCGRERWEVGGLCLLDFDFDLSIFTFYVDFFVFWKRFYRVDGGEGYGYVAGRGVLSLERFCKE